MSHDELKLACAGYALGILDAAEHRELEAHLVAGCAECQAELDDLGSSVALLAASVPPHDASRRLKRRVLSHVASNGFYCLPAAESEWEPTEVPGVELRRLFIQPEDDRESLVLRMAAGTRHDGIAGLAPQACFVLSGGLQIGDVPISEGETARFEAGAPTHRWSSPHGCSMFLTTLPARMRASATTMSAALAHVRPADIAWVAIGPGAYARPVFVDAQGGSNAIARMDAGYVYTEHHHDGAEELFVVEGDCSVQGFSMGPGDYHRAGRGTDHGVTATRGGCVLILISQP